MKQDLNEIKNEYNFGFNDYFKLEHKNQDVANKK